MTGILFHDASIITRHLDARLRSVLEQLPGADADGLATRLNTDRHEKPSLVFTGQYSSGKSTLIKALTDGSANVVIDSDIATDSIEEFDWSGVVRLIDTPGVQAGVSSHDDLAEQALLSADLVLFTVTVELFDDPLIAHLRHVISDLGKGAQTIVVLTKTGTMDAAEGVRDGAVRKALASHADVVPWAECDADNYLKGLAHRDKDPDRSARYIELSGILRLKKLINRIARERGELARFSQPLQQIALVAAEADAGLVEDPNEASALIVLARQRSALSDRRDRLEVLLERHRTEFQSQSLRSAGKFADAIEQAETDGLTDAESEQAVAHLNRELDTAAERFSAAVERTLEIQFNDLASELGQIESSPHARVLVNIEDPAIANFGDFVVTADGPRGPVAESRAWAADVSQFLKQFHDLWGAGTGVKSAAGTTGHRIVLKAGHALGKNFKPWEAARYADRIGKFARVGGNVIALGAEAYGVIADERAAVQAEHAIAARRRALTHEILTQCDGIADASLRHIRSLLDETFSAEFDRIDEVVANIHGSREEKHGLSHELDEIQSEARAALDDLAGRSASESPV